MIPEDTSPEPFALVALPTSKEVLTAIWLQARNCPIGLLIQASDPGKVRQQLYSVRKELGDEIILRMQIRASPFPDGNLVLVHGEGEAKQTLPTTGLFSE